MARTKPAKPRKARKKAAARAPKSAATAPSPVPASHPKLSLTERAYAEIRHRVITLAFRPGEFLNESMICDSLGIGRTPVHEALHRLQLEGLVQIVPRKGVMIRTDSLNDVIALIETRMVVEPAGMALAADRAEPPHLLALELILRQARQAIKQGDRAGYMALDAKFHNEIVRATGNSVLAEVIRMLHQRASRIWHLQVWSDADLRLTQIEHEAIYEALKAGSAERTATAARAHLTSLRGRIMNVVSLKNAAE